MADMHDRKLTDEEEAEIEKAINEAENEGLRATDSTITKDEFTHFLQCLLDDSWPGIPAEWVRDELLKAVKVLEEEIAWDEAEASDRVANLNTDTE